MLITIVAALYRRHHSISKKNEEIKDLAHDGNFTLPSKVPSIPSNAEAGQYWRIGVDPAAKGAVHHDDDLQIVSDAMEGSETSSVDELWEEVAGMVDCPSPNPRDYRQRKRRAGSVGSRIGLKRSRTGKMSVASTDSGTSRYSQTTDGWRYIEEANECEGLSLRWL